MANGTGASRIGRFLGGAVMGLIVCTIGLVALSLAAPLPDRPVVEVEVPGGAAVQAVDPAAGAGTGTPVPETVTIPAEDVTVVPAGEATGQARPSTPADEGSAVPQATSQAEAAGDGDAPQAGNPDVGDSFMAPQSPSPSQ